MPSQRRVQRRYVFCGTSRPRALKPASRTLSGTLPCGVRTFLSRQPLLAQGLPAATARSSCQALVYPEWTRSERSAVACPTTNNHSHNHFTSLRPLQPSTHYGRNSVPSRARTRTLRTSHFSEFPLRRNNHANSLPHRTLSCALLFVVFGSNHLFRLSAAGASAARHRRPVLPHPHVHGLSVFAPSAIKIAGRFTQQTRTPRGFSMKRSATLLIASAFIALLFTDWPDHRKRPAAHSSRDRHDAGEAGVGRLLHRAAGAPPRGDPGRSRPEAARRGGDDPGPPRQDRGLPHLRHARHGHRLRR